MRNNNLYEEQLMNEEYLQPAMKAWDIGVVLCLYKPESPDVVRRMVSLWGNKLDKQFGNVKRGKKYSISQRIEKVPSLDFGKEKRGWHANIVLGKPKHISYDLFIFQIKLLWLEVLSIRYKRKFFTNAVEFEIERRIVEDGKVAIDTKLQRIELAWASRIDNGFKIYASRKRTITAKQLPGIDTPNDLIVHEALVTHSTQ